MTTSTRGYRGNEVFKIQQQRERGLQNPATERMSYSKSSNRENEVFKIQQQSGKELFKIQQQSENVKERETQTMVRMMSTCVFYASV